MKQYLIKDNECRWQHLNAKAESYHKAHPTHTLIYRYARVSSDNNVDQIVCCNGLNKMELDELFNMGFMTHDRHFNMFIKRAKQ